MLPGVCHSLKGDLPYRPLMAGLQDTGDHVSATVHWRAQPRHWFSVAHWQSTVKSPIICTESMLCRVFCFLFFKWPIDERRKNVCLIHTWVNTMCCCHQKMRSCPITATFRSGHQGQWWQESFRWGELGAVHLRIYSDGRRAGRDIDSKAQGIGSAHWSGAKLENHRKTEDKEGLGRD